MDCADPLVDIIVDAVRDVVGPAVPVIFMTGHSHRRAYRRLDSNAASFEAGHYLDTIGFLSFSSSDNNKNNNKNLTETRLRYRYIDAKQQTLYGIVNKMTKEQFDTPNGIQLTGMIRQTQQSLGLYDVLGCSSTSYILEQGYRSGSRSLSLSESSSSSSLWWLYLNDIVPNQLFKSIQHMNKHDNDDGNIRPIFVQGTGAFRYSLYRGRITVDDVIAVCPFNDPIYQFDYTLRGDDVLTVLDRLERTVSTPLHTRYEEDFPSFGVSPPDVPIDPNGMYRLYLPDFEYHRIAPVIDNLTNHNRTATAPQRVCPNRAVDECLYTTDLWRNYVVENMPCNDDDDAGRLHLHGVVRNRFVAMTTMMLPPRTDLARTVTFPPAGLPILLAVIVLVASNQLYRRQRRRRRQPSINDHIPVADDTITTPANQGYGTIA
jgi:hypothetical protein